MFVVRKQYEMRKKLMIVYLLGVVLLKFGYCSVISGEPYCSDSSSDNVSYAVPGSNISITCVTDSPADIAPSLRWDVVSITLSHTNFQAGNVVSEQGFVSRINSANSTEGTTNATLTFSAKSVLDGAVVMCRGAQLSVINSCTLFILTIPTAPTNFTCTDITNDSLTLQWGEPTDNGGEEVDYSITVVPVVDIPIVRDETMKTVENLKPNDFYNFTIKANNSQGSGPESFVECTTQRNNPPPEFDNITVCLDVGTSSPDTTLIVEPSPCPFKDLQNFTPKITNYVLDICGTSDVPAVENNATMCTFREEVPQGIYTVNVTATNTAGNTTTSFRNSSGQAEFYAFWLRDVKADRTDSAVATAAAIRYTTAECVEQPNNLMIELTVLPPSAAISGDSSVPYVVNSTSSFSLENLTLSETIMFTLQVVAISPNVTVYSTADSFVVPTITTLSSSSMLIIITTTNTSSTSESLRPTSTMKKSSSNLLPIIFGVFGGILAIVAIIGIILAVIGCYVWCKNRNNRNKTSVDLLNIKGGSGGDIFSLSKLKQQQPETGQALYQDPDTIERQQAPTGDMYALPDKPRRQPPPPGLSATATYQDPNTIERQQAPTGDMYAMPQKKPQYSKVDKANKGSPAMYAELGFEDGNQPPISPSGQPLIPQDKAQVMYAAVRGQ